MSEHNGSIAYVPEAVPPALDIEQPLLAEAGIALSQHDTPPVALTPEMPASHPDVDVGTLTVGGLIKACPHYARLAETNPRLANTEAAEVVQRVQAREAMRESGMSNDAIKKQQWSAMRQRHNEKIKVEEEPMPEKVVQGAEIGSSPRLTAEQRIATFADAEGVLAAPHHEVAEAKLPQRSMVPAASVRESAALPEVVAAPVVGAAQSEAEQTHIAVAKASVAPVEGSTSWQDAILEAAYEHTPPVDLPTVTDVLSGHEHLPDLAASRETEGAALDTQLRQLPFGEFSDVADLTSTEEVALLPAAIETSLDNGEITEAVSSSAVVAKLELPVVPEQQTWSDVLEKEPLELCADFTEALQSLVAPPEGTTLTINETTDTDEPAVLIDGIQKLQPPPTVAMDVVERLSGLDAEEKEAVAPALRAVVEAVQVVNEAEPEAIETASAELEELVTVLFEQLGIECEPEDIEYFVATLLRPDFQPVQAEELVGVNLEHDGTREAKLHLAQFVSDGLSGVKEAARLLGKIVVFCTARPSLSEYEPAV